MKSSHYDMKMREIFCKLYQNLPKDILLHGENTADYAFLLFRALKEHTGKDAFGLTERGIYLGAVYHDVGKIMVPQNILVKKEPLTQEERMLVARHVWYGGDIAAVILSPENAEYLTTVYAMANAHHERWDGKGYPCRIKAESIPIEARICSIADSFDAMVSKRAYHDRMPEHKALEEIMRGAGSQFDPMLAQLFVDCFPPDDNGKIVQISKKFHKTPSGEFQTSKRI